MTLLLARKAMRDARGTATAGALFVLAIVWLHVAVYPQYGELEQMQFPEALSGLFGEAGSMAVVEGYVASFWGNCLVVAGVLAIILGTSAVVGEEGAGTLDLLLAQPLRRSSLLAAKAIGLAAALSLVVLAAVPGFVLGNLRAGLDLTLGDFVAVGLSGIAPTLVFLSLALLASVVLPSRALAVIVSSAVLVLAYFANALGTLVGLLEVPRRLSPFFWSDASHVLVHGFDWTRALAQLAVALLLLALAAVALERREIATGPHTQSMRRIRRRGTHTDGTGSSTFMRYGGETLSLLSKSLHDVRLVAFAMALATFGFALLLVLLYPAYRDALQDFEYPGVLQGLLGEAGSIASPAGFMSAEYFLLAPLLLGAVAIIAGTGATAGEESAGTLDLLLAQPLGRRRLILTKLIASVAVLTFAAAAGIPGFALGRQFVEIDLATGRFALASAVTLLLAVLWHAAALCAGAVLPNRAAASTTVAGVLAASYLLQIVGATAQVLNTPRRLSPFYWADPSHVLVHGLDWWRVSALLGVAAMLLVVALAEFERRDIATGGAGWSISRWKAALVRGVKANRTH